ncbi:MAG: DUF4402 domain-containing protein [Sphingomonadaceae bacterium]
MKIIRPAFDWLSFCRVLPGFALAAVLAIVLTCGLAAPARAQVETSGTARIVVIEPLSLVKMKDLDFGKIIVDGAGTIVLTPAETATCTASANLAHSGPCQPAVFAGLSSRGRFLTVRAVDSTITLTGPGDDMIVDNLTINGSPELTPFLAWLFPNLYRNTSADGAFEFRLGGRLNVGADQQPGVYSGTFNVRVDYY